MKQLDFRDHSQTDKRIFLREDQGLILFLNTDKIEELIYIEQTSDLSSLNIEQKINGRELKFIGCENIFNDILGRSELGRDDFNKIQMITEYLEVFCYLKDGKVRIKKGIQSSNNLAHTSTIEDEKQEIVKKKVLIIDDSSTMRKILNKIISASSNFEVMDMAEKPSDAKAIIERERPDIITLDIHMPEMNGVEFLKSYLKFKNIPTILITSVTKKEGPLVMEGLNNGACSYIQKPSMDEISKSDSKIIETLETYSEKNVITDEVKRKSYLRFSDTKGLIAIGSSTGGTQALKTLFSQFPDQIPPIVVTQHIPASFSQALAESLDAHLNFKVKEAENAEIIQPNTIYIAHGGSHLKILKQKDQLVCRLTDDPPVGKFKPSVDYLFESLAKLELENLVTVMLTGMGRDGATWMTKLNELGVTSVVQDEESCVVFGMPKAVIDLGGADHVVNLSEMGEKIVNVYNNGNKKNKDSAA